MLQTVNVGAAKEQSVVEAVINHIHANIKGADEWRSELQVELDRLESRRAELRQAIELLSNTAVAGDNVLNNYSSPKAVVEKPYR